MSGRDLAIAAEEAVYVYCFADDVRVPLDDLPAIDERRSLRVHRHASLAAVISLVTRNAFEGESGETHLSDLAWIAPRVLRQEAILRRIMAAEPVLPLPFGTLFSSLQALEQAMDSRRAIIKAVLRRIDGCQEWAVQGALDRRRAVDARIAAAIAEGSYSPAASTGRRHLEEQRLRRELDRSLDSWISSLSTPLREALEQVSRDAVARRVIAGQDQVFNWAFLVPVAGLHQFQERVDAAARAHAELGLHLTCKGPLPPYSFCSEAA